MTTAHSLRVHNEQVRILIVDDEPANTEFLRHVLAPEGYGELVEHTHPLDALDDASGRQPDLILLDLMMPDLDGYAFLQRLRERVPPSEYLPVLVVTGDHSTEAQRRALSLGARDFVTKPVSPAEIRLRVRNLLETRFLQLRLQEYNLLLEQRVSERTAELEATRLEILNRLARAAEYRDDDTGQHTQRVGRVAARLATVIGAPAEQVELIRRAAPLHDIGKIGIPDAILLKPGKLTDRERGVMEDHTGIGADILSGSRFPLLRLAEEIALVHHERWDGTGYPNGLAAEDIPIAGRVVAVADVFDSLTHERPYKRAWSTREALVEIEASSGSHFDPQVVEAMLRIVPEIPRLQRWEPPAPDGATRSPSTHPEPSETSGSEAMDPWAGAGPAEVEALVGERDRLRRRVQELEEEVARRDRKIAEISDDPARV